jgi:hypothetical protein
VGDKVLSNNETRSVEKKLEKRKRKIINLQELIVPVLGDRIKATIAKVGLNSSLRGSCRMCRGFLGLFLLFAKKSDKNLTIESKREAFFFSAAFAGFFSSVN